MSQPETGRESWGLIGAGMIGQELMRQLSQPEVAARLGLEERPQWVINSRGAWEAPEPGSNVLEVASRYSSIESVPDDQFPDVHFLAMPSGLGDVAMDYLTHIMGRDGAKAVTAEKGAIASNFAELKERSDNFHRLGVTATVGGGTRLVRVLRNYIDADPGNMTQLHLALNGTLSHIMGAIGPHGDGSDALSRGQAVAQAIQLGYAEPGSTAFDAVVRAEAQGDVPKKTAILFNLLALGGDETLNANDLEFSLTDSDLRRLAREAKTRRCVVSILAKKFHELVDPAEEDIIGGFNQECDGFQIVGGFQNVETGVLAHFGRFAGPENGAIIGLGPNETDGMYRVSGPGAGPAPTVNTMLDDYARLLQGAQAA